MTVSGGQSRPIAPGWASRWSEHCRCHAAFSLPGNPDEGLSSKRVKNPACHPFGNDAVVCGISADTLPRQLEHRVTEHRQLAELGPADTETACSGSNSAREARSDPVLTSARQQTQNLKDQIDFPKISSEVS